MKKEEFCSPENISVVIPYRDFEKLVGFAKEYNTLLTRFSQVEKQLGALHGLYHDVLEKLGEINRYL